MNDTALRTELEALRVEVAEIRRTTKPNDRTADQWRTIAHESHVAEVESFDRCDTDGFLSQWAHNQMQMRYQYMARIAEEGGTASIHAVFDLDGNLVTTQTRQGEYGDYWFIPQNEGKARFFNDSNANKLTTRRTNNAKKGYRIGSVRVNVNMTEYDCTITDDVVSVETIDLYRDWLAEGRTSYFD